MILTRNHSKKRGFLLLEVVLALGIFGIAATGFAVALHRMADAADMAQRELRLTRILDGALKEALSLPTLDEGTTTVVVPDSDGMELDTTIELMSDLENKDGQALQEMYHITVTAHWYETSGWQERSVETWRYGQMYQPS
ncbi:type II secretion system protein [Luteolibacter pohnpeiensis]|uniref:Type II secretion system protein n=1 Tax=Luteolibacter pohnpeiensis TaxID=454153 RepID=A0A934S4D9_9BACT|nr:type II secretion system protein [Luteolibacter pohnpeiensis]MBK1882940.1 type II secretion system protein [Luteolibacter pohnpeiensis]